MLKKIRESVEFLRASMEGPPLIAMITGTGLGSLTERLATELRLPYVEVPHFPQSTAKGHQGTLAAGILGGKRVIALEGRFHLYEGYSAEAITFPVRVMAQLGARYLCISSAAGGLNPQFRKGDLMIVSDHINLTCKNPLVGPNLDLFGPRFPDMSSVYDRDLMDLVTDEALKLRIPVQKGVYAGVLGPSLETPAETRFLRMIGADAVGMSTVLEAIVGVHCGMRIGAIVVITNVNLPDCMGKTSIEEVIEVATKAGPTLSLLWEKVVKGLKVSSA